MLIALALEGTVSWIDHRLLVREAVANLSAELRDSQRELDGLFANLGNERRQLQRADEIANVLLAQGPMKNLELELDAHSAELKSTALRTGVDGR